MENYFFSAVKVTELIHVHYFFDCKTLKKSWAFFLVLYNFLTTSLTIFLLASFVIRFSLPPVCTFTDVTTLCILTLLWTCSCYLIAFIHVWNIASVTIFAHQHRVAPHLIVCTIFLNCVASIRGPNPKLLKMCFKRFWATLILLPQWIHLRTMGP